MQKEKLIDHIKNDIYCRLQPSAVAGIGVFAIRDIPKGTNPFKTCSTKRNNDKIIIIKDSEIGKVDDNIKKLLKDFFGSTESDSSNSYDVLASGPNNINISFYMNHSNKPNIDIIESDNEEYLSFLSNRTIKKGEELFINYNNYDNF